MSSGGATEDEQEEISGRWGPYRQGSPPARHRPGAWSARRGWCPILPQTEGDFTVGLLKQSVLRLEPLEDRCLLSGDVVLQWNELLVQSLASQPPRVPLARNMALVHVAMFDAINSIERTYEPYFVNVPAPSDASLEAAAAQAAHDTLAALYPTRQAIFDAALAGDLAGIPLAPAQQGILVGQQVAQQILTLRSNDGAAAIVPYVPPNTDPGQWQPTAPDFSAA